MPDRRSNHSLTVVALATALAIGGCVKPADSDNVTAAVNASAALPALPATLPMATGAVTAAAVAPPVAALPAARPIRAVRVANSRDAYAYADDAYAFSHAVGNAPPDYGFDYRGTEPWAWQGYDESRTFVEPVADGYRYYYYRPGADTPYFVRDPDYGYGYDNGALAVVYGAGGAVLPYADYGPRLGYASRYLARGEELYRASRGNERRAVIAANWAARQNAIAASRDRWAEAAARQAGWQAYRARVADQQAQHWAQEAARRDADARRFASWHDDGFRAAPPPRAIPVAWQQAPWAQDQTRYRIADRQPSQPAPQPQPRPQQQTVQLPNFQPPQPVAQPPFPPPGHPGRVDRRPAGSPLVAIAPTAAPPVRSTDTPARTADRRTAADAVRRQQGAVRANDQRQAHASTGQARAQQVANDRPPVSVDRPAQPAMRRPRGAPDRPPHDLPPVVRDQPAVVRVHRGSDMVGDGGGGPRAFGRQQPTPRIQPPGDDRHAAERRQPPRQMPPAMPPTMHRPDVVVHQQAAPHAFPQAPHNAPPRPVMAAPRPAPAPHAPPAPHNGGQHGEHRP